VVDSELGWLSMIPRTKRVLVILALSFVSLGCVFLEPEYTVTPSFSVHISNRYGPVAGLKLRATRPKDNLPSLISDELRAKLTDEQIVRVMESVTDANGDAHFDLDRLGHWYLEADSPGRRSYVSVYADPHFDSTKVNLQWPESEILETRALRGRLSDGLTFSYSYPLKQTDLSLRTYVSFAEVATTKTGDDGSFQFDRVEPGLYFLGIGMGHGSTQYQVRGYIPIYIGDDGPRERLSIAMDKTDCGLEYDLEENKPLHRPHSCSKGSGERIPCP
jgi:hypothetical protein